MSEQRSEGKIPKARFGLRILVGYLAANLLLFFANPYASPWHYGSQDPAPIEVMAPTDSDLSLDQITRILDSIDLSYGAREPTATEKIWLTGKQFAKVVFLPSSFALGIKEFYGYLGPANSQQRAFTVSVKKRYNHLATLAVKKGMKKDGFLFQEEPSLSKKNGEPFASLR
jgi:hypothetical protein